MARAFICLARNDLSPNLLQITDLIPNTSLRNFPYTPPGQTGYLSQFVQNGAYTLVDQGGGVYAPTTTVYGLAAYLQDVVEDTSGGNLAIVAADAIAISADILARMAAGGSVTLVDINADIVAQMGAGNDLEGTLGASTGSVEDVLRILSGESYKVAADTPISGGTNAFLVAPGGAFTTDENRIRSYTTGAGGRPIQSAPVVPMDAIDQSEVPDPRLMNQGVVLNTPATADTAHRDIRVLVDTPDLHRSVLGGVLSKLVDGSFVFSNPSFTYGAAGTATDSAGVALSIDGAARAVTIYKADGTTI